MRKICLVLGLLFALLLAGGEAQTEEQIVAAVKKVMPAVVSITLYKSGAEVGIGSGVIIRKDGYILTNTHVIRGAEQIKVSLSNQRQYHAQIWKISQEQDLAIIKINPQGPLPVPQFGRSSALQLGQTVIAIGNPLRFSFTVTQGIVSALGRDLNSQGMKYEDLIQTDAAINRGSSGGALVNLQGQVVGINTLVYMGGKYQDYAQGLSFAIPINQALKVAGNLLAGSKPGTLKPWIGISGATLTADYSLLKGLTPKVGVYITEVTPSGPAAQAGILPGDVITEAGDKPINNKDDLKNLVGSARPGQILELGVWRKDEKLNLSIKVEQQNQ